MTMHYRNFVAGEWRDSSSANRFLSVNPANRKEEIGAFPRSSKEDVDQAVAAAQEAYPSWARRPAPERGAIIMKFASLLTARAGDLAKLVTRETGKSIRESRGEIQAAVDTVHFWAGESRRLYGETMPSEVADKFTMTLRCPIGPTAVISAWNVPIIMAAQKLIPALIAGNTAVYKPSEDTPAVANALIEMLVEAGIPNGAVNLVHGFGSEVGEALVEHSGIRMITFTGGTTVGREISGKAGRALKRVSLELGGKNCIIVMDDADIDIALAESVRSAFATSGQRCSAASRILVHRRILDQFSSRFLDRVGALRVADGLDEATDMGPLINERQLKRVHEYTIGGAREGAELISGGKVLEDAARRDGFFYAPTVFASVKPTMRIAREEIFGPMTSLIPIDGLEQAMQIANDVEYGLVGSIFTRDVRHAFWALREFDTGVVAINRGTAGTEAHLPFGGVKGSGVGYREGGGKASIDTFTEWKTILIDYSRPI